MAAGIKGTFCKTVSIATQKLQQRSIIFFYSFPVLFVRVYLATQGSRDIKVIRWSAYAFSLCIHSMSNSTLRTNFQVYSWVIKKKEEMHNLDLTLQGNGISLVFDLIPTFPCVFLGGHWLVRRVRRAWIQRGQGMFIFLFKIILQ